MLARAFLLRLRGDAGHARDDEQRIRNFRRDADVAADGGNRAVDIYGQPLARGPFREYDFHGPDHLNVPAFDFQLQRHLKQSRGARIARMEAVTEAGDWLRRCVPSLDDLARSIAVRDAFADQ